MTSPSIGAYNTSAISVGTSPTLIATVEADSDGVLVQNTGSVTVYLGGATVAASGANLGFALAGTNAYVLVPSTGGPANSLFGITASSTSTVVTLFPSGA